MIDAFNDLQILCDFIGTTVPAAAATTSQTNLFAPLLVSPKRATFPWQALSTSLASYFHTTTVTATTVLDRGLIYSGWNGLPMMIACFKRTESALNPQEIVEIEMWINALLKATVARSLDFLNSNDYRFKEVVSDLLSPLEALGLPVNYTAKSIAVPRDISTSYPLSSLASTSHASGSSSDRIQPVKLNIETLKVVENGGELSPLKKRLRGGNKIDSKTTLSSEDDDENDESFSYKSRQKTSRTTSDSDSTSPRSSSRSPPSASVTSFTPGSTTFPANSYFWSASTNSLHSLPSPIYTSTSEILTFPPTSFSGVLKPDHSVPNDFLRNQGCVNGCEFVMNKIKKPIRMREHLVHCKVRRLHFEGKRDDPLGRLCFLQISAQRIKSAQLETSRH